MEKITFSIGINASREKVWNTMLEKDTYQQWTVPFHEGSTYDGNWEEGSEMRFIGPSEDGTVSGMYAVIAANRLHEFISIKHLGELQNGVKNPWPVVEGQEGYENYTFKEVDDGTEVVLQHQRTPEEYKKFIEELQEEINRLIEFSNDLLFLAQNKELEKKSFEAFSLSELCVKQGEQFVPYATSKNIVLHSEIESGVTIKGRQQDITRLLMNLLKNAIDYNKREGKVTLKLQVSHKKIIMTVEDTGIGIAKKDIPHIFDRFYKADASRAQAHTFGSGLGLSIVKEIVTMHGGEIRIESTLGQGTLFEIIFPLA